MRPIAALTKEDAKRLLIQAQIKQGVPEKTAKSYASHLYSVFIRHGWVLVGRDEFALAMHAVSSQELLKAKNVGKSALERIEKALEMMHRHRH